MEFFTGICYLLCSYIIFKILKYVVQIPKLGSLSEKWILITGCDTGFGHLAAKRFIETWTNVFAGCLTEKGENEIRKICTHTDRLITFHLDVTDSESINKALVLVKKKLPPRKGLWGLINNAGVSGPLGAIDWITVKSYKRVLYVNLLGLINTTTKFLPLIKQDKGRIVNTASIAGRYATPYLGPYSITKYGVESFSDALRRRLHQYGVSVHIIEPGYFATNITAAESFARAIDAAWKDCPEDVKQSYGERYYQGLKKTMVENVEGSFVSKKISKVVDAYEHALIGRYPCPRYVIGLDTYIWQFVWLFPEWIGDWICLVTVGNVPVPSELETN